MRTYTLTIIEVSAEEENTIREFIGNTEKGSFIDTTKDTSFLNTFPEYFKTENVVGIFEGKIFIRKQG